MRKLVHISLVAVLVVFSCKRDNNNDTPKGYPILDEQTQKEYDDSAIKEYLNSHYFDERGRVKAIPSGDDSKEKLSNHAKVLSSGVVYVIRPDAQPTNGIDVTDNKVLSMMLISHAARAVWLENKSSIGFIGDSNFANTINTGGDILRDPMWHYVKNKDIESEQERLDKNPNNKIKITRNFFEIEGFKEAIKKFKSFDNSPDENYNLQGLIIVPSRAAFGKEPHYIYTDKSLNDHTFFFNFQLYKAEDRKPEEK